MNNRSSIFSILAIFTITASIYATVVFLALDARGNSLLLAYTPLHLLVIVLTARFLPNLLRRLNDPGAPLRSATMRPVVLYFSLLVLVALALFAPFPHTGGGQSLHVALWAISSGLILATAYLLFFQISGDSRRGVFFGSSLGLGLLSWRVIIAFLGDGDIAHPTLATVKTCALAGIATASVMVAITAFANRGRLLPPAPFADRERDHARRKTIDRIIRSACLFFLLNSFLGARTFLFLPAASPFRFTAIHALAIPLCPIVGWLMDRDKRGTYRILMVACSLFFVLAPSLVALDHSPYLYRTILMLTSLGQMAITTAMPIALAALVREGRWFGVTLCAVYCLRGLTIVGGWLEKHVVTGIPSGLVVFFSILSAIVFYAIARRVDLSPRVVGDDRPPAANSPPNDVRRASGVSGTGASVQPEDFALEPADDNAPIEEQSLDAVAELLASRGLSPREHEIAKLLILGLSTRDISERLGIAENTVKSHVRQILRKFNVPNRKVFMATFVTFSE